VRLPKLVYSRLRRAKSHPSRLSLTNPRIPTGGAAPLHLLGRRLALLFSASPGPLADVAGSCGPPMAGSFSLSLPQPGADPMPQGSDAGSSPSMAQARHPLYQPTSVAMQRFNVALCQDEEEAEEMAARQVALDVRLRSGGASSIGLGEGDGAIGLPIASHRGVSSSGVFQAAQPRAAPANGSGGDDGVVEPEFLFVVVPSADALKDVSDIFVSAFMMDVTSEWPQPSTSRLRRQQSAIGKESRGARKGANRGSNATTKT